MTGLDLAVPRRDLLPPPPPWLDALWHVAETIFDQAVSRFFYGAMTAHPVAAHPAVARPVPLASPPRPAPSALSSTASTLREPTPLGSEPSASASFDLAKLADLDDDFVKLVGYSVVSLRRGRERWVKGGSEVVARRMTREAFVSWMIARHVDSIEPGEEPFLRVHFTVARRWPREPLEFEERQLEELSAIREALSFASEPAAATHEPESRS